MSDLMKYIKDCFFKRPLDTLSFRGFVTSSGLPIVDQYTTKQYIKHLIKCSHYYEKEHQSDNHCYYLLWFDDYFCVINTFSYRKATFEFYGMNHLHNPTIIKSSSSKFWYNEDTYNTYHEKFLNIFKRDCGENLPHIELIENSGAVITEITGYDDKVVRSKYNTVSEYDYKLIAEEYHDNNNDLLHREGGPAIWKLSYSDIYDEKWYINGGLHRIDGPALISVWREKDENIDDRINIGFYKDGELWLDAINYWKENKNTIKFSHENNYTFSEEHQTYIKLKFL